jgi:hypothetical protein
MKFHVKLALALAVLGFLAGGPVTAQGTLPVALSQQVDSNGRPLVGALLYIYVVGTVATPQFAFQDSGLTQQLPWPLVADRNGRLPMFYLASGNVHARLTDGSGNVQFDFPSILVIGAPVGGGGGGGGGGGTIDPTTIASTGDVKWRMADEGLGGWVKLNGLTIGSAVSGASGLASSVTQSLFIYLWNKCASTSSNNHCAVSGGLGSSGLADFNANKTIHVPDMRDRMPAGRDCMESTCLGGILTANVTSGGSDGADTPFAFGGQANTTLLQSQLPTVNFTVSGITLTNPAHTHTTLVHDPANLNGGAQIGAGGNEAATAITSSSVAQATSVATQGVAASGGSAANIGIISPFTLGSWYMKL